MSDWLGSLAKLAGPALQLGGAYLASNANRQAANTQVAAGDRALQAQLAAQQQAIAAQTNAQQQAAALQADSTNRALALQADMYNQNRADLQPWRDTGSAALQNLAGQVGQWGPGTPAYDFQFSEGMRALDNSASARGMVQSGATMKAAQRFGQGLAAQGRGEELNRLQALAGVGQTATTQGVGLGQNYAQAAGGLTAGLGQNLAQGQTALGSALGGIYGQAGNAAAGIYGQQGLAAANGVTGAAQPWQTAANNIWALTQKPGGGW
jgi:hypothetical protein